MSVWLIWIIIAAILAVAEIFTGSFYLILAGMGALGAAALAGMGAPLWAQISAAALVTFIGWALLHKLRPQNKFPFFQSNPALNMDIGASVRISDIAPSGKITVRYRGADWSARMQDGVNAELNKDFTIKQIDGSTLILGE